MKNNLLPNTNILPKMADGGKTPRDGATKKSDNKGKKIVKINLNNYGKELTLEKH